MDAETEAECPKQFNGEHNANSEDVSASMLHKFLSTFNS